MGPNEAEPSSRKRKKSRKEQESPPVVPAAPHTLQSDEISGSKKEKKKRRKERTAEAESSESAEVPPTLCTLTEGTGPKGLKKKKKKRKAETEPCATDNAAAATSDGEGKKSKKKKRREEATANEHKSSPHLRAPPSGRPLPLHQLVLAPMVGGSELAYRLLARRHGVQLAYTPMMHADRFADDPKYRAAELQTNPEDTPLVAHFCGNDPKVLLAAAKLAEPHCVAIDLNLGCPQRAARAGCFGSYARRPGDTTEAMDVGLVLEIVSTLAKGLSIPLFCKIRLFDELKDTVAFCRALEEAGCALLAVHARYRGSPTHRREGAAHLDHVAAIKAAVSIPVLSNGNVSSPADLLAALTTTHADGVMSAEGALDDPAIFGRAATLAATRRRELSREIKQAKGLRDEAAKGRALTPEERKVVDRLKAAKRERKALPKFNGVPAKLPPSAPCDLAEQYLTLARTHPPTLECLIFHLRRICRDGLLKYELRQPLDALGTSVSERTRKQPVKPNALAAAAALIRQLREYEDGRREFTPTQRPEPTPAVDPTVAAATAVVRVSEAAARAKAAAAAAAADPAARAAAKAACAAKRRDFENMQRRKAKRKGLPEDHFLCVGRAPPTVADVDRVKRMGETERMAFWREHYGQHCIMHHLNGQCDVALAWGCGFLHEAAV